MEMKPYLKQTEAGLIPENWEVEYLGTLAETSSGTTPSRALRERYYHNGSIAWVKTLDLNDSEITATDEMVTEFALKETSLKVYPTRTVLIAMYGGFNQIGRTGLLRIPAAVNQAITAIRPNAAKLVPEFLLRVLNYRVGYWRIVASSSRKDPNITSKDVREFRVAFPAPAEQKSIAEALSDVDALIDSIEQLLAKKRSLKQGAMQELLTGKMRLPGFEVIRGFKHTEIGRIPKDWEVKPLASLISALEAGVSVNSIGNDKAVYAHEKSILKTSCVTGGKFMPEECKSIIPDDIHRAKLNPRADSIVISRMNTPALVGECGYVDQDWPNLFLPDRLWMTRHQTNVPHSARWLNYLLSFSSFSRAIKEAATGTSGSMKNISKGSLLALSIPLPSKTEQEAIAGVICSMEFDIGTLETKVVKARRLKKGMMQELLTGRIRLV